jgi:peptidoglycan/LPS O-acetylase OafA/YrhL
MRPIKQLGVVTTHSLLAFAPAVSSAAGASLLLLHVSREAFLFVSACMLTYGYAGLARTGLSTFYRRRFMSIGVPYLCWTTIYFAVTYRAAGWGTSLGHFGYLLATGYYQLYYLLVIAQFYVIFPLVAPALIRARRWHGQILVVSAVVQLLVVSLQHWSVLPAGMQGFWATREIVSYQFYVVAGMIVALHLEDVHKWLLDHVRMVVSSTIAAAAVAEGWYGLATLGHMSWLGANNDPFQPIVMPFNIGAIACIYLAGTYLVASGRTRRLRRIIRSGSDNSYGIYLAQMLFILGLTSFGWARLTRIVPWPLLCLATVVGVVGACVALTAVLARTPLSKALTGRTRQAWSTLLPRRAPPGGAGLDHDEGGRTAEIASAIA